MRRLSPPHNPKKTHNRPATGGPIRTCIACARPFVVHKTRRTGSTFAAQSVEGDLQVLHVCAQRASEPHQVLVDTTGSTPGRGAWICASAKCVETAWKRKAIERALKGARSSENLKDELLRACQS